MHHHTDTSQILLNGMLAALDSWANQLDGESDLLYWVLNLQIAKTGLTEEKHLAEVRKQLPEDRADAINEAFHNAEMYFDDIRYASLEPITKIWGTVVNSMRVAAESDRATEGQKSVFSFGEEAVVAFFRAARDRMEVADVLYHVFKAMPAPECQALAALLNVHVDARLDGETMRRLVRLLDHEGPMSAEEQQALSTLSATRLVNAAFSGLRGYA